MMQRLRITVLFAVFAGCLDGHNPAPQPDAAAPTVDAAVAPECRELAPDAALCCQVFCTDPADFDVRCAPVGVCITYNCPLTDGTVIAPEACGPQHSAPSPTCFAGGC